jgi:hypothetical protein
LPVRGGMFAGTGEAAGWVKNIRRNPEVVARIGARKSTRQRAFLTARPIARVGAGRVDRRSEIWDGATGCRWNSPPLSSPDSTFCRSSVTGGHRAGLWPRLPGTNLPSMEDICFSLKSLSLMRRMRTVLTGMGRIVPSRVARYQNGLTPIAPTHAAPVMQMSALGKPVGAVMAARTCSGPCTPPCGR